MAITMAQPTSAPPNGLPAYRILTGPDDAAFCRRVSEALAMGYLLYGSPAATFNGENVIVAQALIWPAVSDSIAQVGASARSIEKRAKRAT